MAHKVHPAQACACSLIKSRGPNDDMLHWLIPSIIFAQPQIMIYSHTALPTGRSSWQIALRKHNSKSYQNHSRYTALSSINIDNRSTCSFFDAGERWAFLSSTSQNGIMIYFKACETAKTAYCGVVQTAHSCGGTQSSSASTTADASLTCKSFCSVLPLWLEKATFLPRKGHSNTDILPWLLLSRKMYLDWQRSEVSIYLSPPRPWGSSCGPKDNHRCPQWSARV